MLQTINGAEAGNLTFNANSSRPPKTLEQLKNCYKNIKTVTRKQIHMILQPKSLMIEYINFLIYMLVVNKPNLNPIFHFRKTIFC